MYIPRTIASTELSSPTTPTSFPFSSGRVAPFSETMPAIRHLIVFDCGQPVLRQVLWLRECGHFNDPRTVFGFRFLGCEGKEQLHSGGA